MTSAPVPRRLTPEEWPLARDLRVAALSESPDAFGSTVERERSLPAAAWHERLSGNAWFAAFQAGAPVGLACGVRVATPGERELTGVWVAPRARGAGVGGALVAAVRDWARGEGARRLTLVVTTRNAPAIGLYRRHGFTAGGPQDAVPGPPSGHAVGHLEMRLDLTP